ncbi:MAG: hypothetical protein M3340_12295, partial [Actinomycetota bacterium]|nr:hypothetical protein [Actinomycetota bacterium]
GGAAGFDSPGLTATVGDDSTTTFRATATDAAGNTSACSTDSIEYVEDSTAPDAPTITDTDPDSPANDNTPLVKGTTGGGSPVSVKVYETAACTGGSTDGTVAAFTGSGIEVTVAQDATTALSARAVDAAGNESSCSNTIDYVEDSTAPGLPTLDDTDPDSPANDNNPEIEGTAESGSTVNIYTTSDCSGSPAATGSAADFASGGLTVTVPDDSIRSFRATATDVAGNTSGCSTDSIGYVEDSTSPDKPSITDTDPDSPANDNNPEVKGTAEDASTVEVFKNGDCSGSPAASGSQSSFASPGITVNVTGDTTTTLTVQATDAAGNESPCSDPVDYVEDSTAPDAPAITDTDPDSPANDDTPLVKGTTGAGSPTAVRVYESADCTGGFTAGTVAAFTGSGIEVTVAEDASTPLSARTVDPAGNESTCSNSITYVEDSTDPAAPALDDTDPDSPANENSPEIKGSAESGSTVNLYTTSDCSGSPAATGSAASFASPGLTVSVADDSSTTYRATATDAAGNVSDCSTDSITYVEDSTDPAKPSITDTDPDSPANDNDPEVKGTAEEDSTVQIFKNGDCSGSPAASGGEDTFESTGITVNVPDDAFTTLTAKAVDASGNDSVCSDPFTYREDTTLPAAPSVTDTDPNSPANDNNPEVKGTAPANSTVSIYTTSDCSGTEAGTGTSTQFEGAGITVSVPNDSTTTFRAKATNGAGDSSCSSTSITYVEDSTAPALPTLDDTDPDSPANDNNPEVKGTAESGSTVNLYTTSDCSGSPAATGSAADFASPGLTVTVPNDSIRSFRATATDAAGNISGCSTDSIGYVEDSTNPAKPSITDTDPDSPANDNNPEVKGTAEDASTVQVFRTSDCSGTAAASGSAATFASPGITVSVADNSPTPLSVRATDAAGNQSACSDAMTFIEDSTDPALATGLSTVPASPSNANAIKVKGTAENGSTVDLFTTSDCSGTATATGSAFAFNNNGIDVTVPSDSSTTFKAKVRDAAGNVSGCSTASVTYVEDSTKPDKPTLSDVDPDSPASDNSPEVKGGAESGSTVRLYATADCTGTPAATGSAASFSSPGLTVTVANDSQTTYRATATDAAGNTSDCSTSTITYVEDSNPPAAPSIDDTDPNSPANDASPEVKGTAEVGSTVQVFKNGNCSGSPAATGSAATFASPGITVSVTEDASTTLTARAVDAVGNQSACSASVTYVEDSSAPAAPAIADLDPNSPSNDNSVEVKGTTGAGVPVQVQVFENGSCSGAADATGTVAQFTGAGITTDVPSDATTTLSARTLDAVGNASACSNSVQYLEDSTAPSIDIRSPASGASFVQGSDVNADYSCSDSGSGLAEGADGCRGSVGVGQPIDTIALGTRSFNVSASDRVGNTSEASRSYTVVPTTTTTLDCTPDPVRTDQPTTCTVTVRRNDTAASGNPTGTVQLTSDPVDGSGECTLAPTSTPGSSACDIVYTPRSGVTDVQALTATYAGDSSSAPSTATFGLDLLTLSVQDNRTLTFNGKGEAKLPVECDSQTGDCTGTVEIRTGAPPKGRLAKAKTTVLGKGRYKIKGRKRGTVKVTLTRAGKAQLKRKRRLSGHAVIRGRQGKGPVRTSAMRVKLRGR